MMINMSMMCPVNDSVALITFVEIPQPCRCSPKPSARAHLKVTSSEGYPSWPPKRPLLPQVQPYTRSAQHGVWLRWCCSPAEHWSGSEDHRQQKPVPLSGGHKPTPCSDRTTRTVMRVSTSFFRSRYLAPCCDRNALANHFFFFPDTEFPLACRSRATANFLISRLAPRTLVRLVLQNAYQLRER